MARKGCARRRRLPGDGGIRRAADGRARLCQPFIPARGRGAYRQPRRAGVHLPSRRLRPVGGNAGEKIEETLRDLAPDADITFTRLAVTPFQVRNWHLPTRPTKASD